MYRPITDECEESLSKLRSQHLYRDFIALKAGNGLPFPFFLDADMKSVATFSSNDYLAMSRNHGAIEASINAARLEGIGVGGSRNIGGTRDLSTEIEQEVASIHEKESGLIFNSGYLANYSSTRVAWKNLNCIVFSDRNNHASIIDGLDGATLGKDKHIFSHNDPNDLRKLLERHADSRRPAVVIFESIYSMDGDIAPIRSIVDVSKDFGAAVFLNEVHAVGVTGENGGGLSSIEKDILHKIDLVIGTFGKAFGTVGGYIAGQRSIVDSIRNLGRGLIFTTALPPTVLASTLFNVRHLRNSDEERAAMNERTDFLKQLLKSRGLPIICDESHIVPIHIGHEHDTALVAKELYNQGFYATPIRFPTVPLGRGRLRITVTPAHTQDLISRFVDALVDALSKSQSHASKGNWNDSYER